MYRTLYDSLLMYTLICDYTTLTNATRVSKLLERYYTLYVLYNIYIYIDSVYAIYRDI